MSDETPTPDHAPADETPKRRPSPTSRARRIGGRPMPAPAGDTSPKPEPKSEPQPKVEPKSQPTPPPVAPRVLTKKSAPADDAAAEPDDAAASGGSGARWIPAVVLGVVALGMAVWLVIASHTVYWAKPDTSQAARGKVQEQVLAAAKKCFATINTYDYRHLDDLVATDLPCATGTFKGDLQKALQNTIIAQAPKAQATQTAQVNKAGIESVSPDGKQWTVLIYGQLSVTNKTTGAKDPRIDVAGAVLTMDKVGDQWLVAKVDSDVGSTIGS